MINLFKYLFPYLNVCIFWFISNYFINISGLFAIIPIYFYTINKKIPFFIIYGLIVYFLIEIRFNSLPILSFVYYIMYFLYNYKKNINIPILEKNILIFFIFIILNSIIILINNPSFNGLYYIIPFILVSVIIYSVLLFIQRLNSD